MGKFYEQIPGNLIQWIHQQKVFWVATAPLAEDGHVNVSPKGYEQTMHVVLSDSDGNDVEASPDDEASGNLDYKKLTSRAIWYEDLSGSGIETISHVRENGRITIMFCAFEGPPMIVRLFGTAQVYEFGTKEYEEFLPLDKRLPGSRAVIWVDIHKVGSSCGFSIPFYAYVGPRNKLRKLNADFEQKEFERLQPCQPAATDRGASSGLTKEEEAFLSMGLKNYWRKGNTKSIDGLPGLLSAFDSPNLFGDWTIRAAAFRVPDDESVPLRPNKEIEKGSYLARDFGNQLVGFGAGLLVSTFVTRMLHQVK